MRISKFVHILALLTLLSGLSLSALAQSQEQPSSGATKKERSLILDGNNLYRSKKYSEAKRKYQLALKENPKSNVAAFNLGLANLRIAGEMNDNDSIAKALIDESAGLMNRVAENKVSMQNLSSRAYYNLGNLSFMSQQYGQAIQSYKMALRLNPSDNNARRNLRIAQKKKQEQDKNNQNQQQNQQNQQDKQDKKDKQQNPPPPQKPKINNQTSQQILEAIERKENQTRMKRLGAPSQPSGRSGKNW